jgi:tellurite methyltransferase
MEQDYWQWYYAKNKEPSGPSLFAKYIVENHAKSGNTLIELGCGNGRDALFFIKKGLKVTALDSCKTEINYLKKRVMENVFICTDFTMLDVNNKYDIIYSRFTLHSITESEENRVLDWCEKSIMNGGYFCIEARGLKNELYGKGIPVEQDINAFIFDDHYRRFIDINILCAKLERRNFEIVLSSEEKGYAPQGENNDIFFRVIAVKLISPK